MIIKFRGKRYYILEDRPPPQPDPYGPDMWGYIANPPYKTQYLVDQLRVKQKITRVGPPRPPKVYTPEEAADRLASIEKKKDISSDALLAYNKRMLQMMAGHAQFSPRTLSDWMGTSPGMNSCTSNCEILHTPPCSAFGDCGITGCSNVNCAPCTTSFYGPNRDIITSNPPYRS